jgi:Tol biopolymer transport system component
LTRDAALSTEPALSPDGKLVAYVSDRSGERHTDIWVKQVAGGLPVRLTKHPAADYSPVFSADGTIIYFASARDGGGIYSIPALGGDERAVLKQQQNMAGRMKGSPDGAWIA